MKSLDLAIFIYSTEVLIVRFSGPVEDNIIKQSDEGRQVVKSD